MATKAMLNRYDGVMEDEVVGHAVRKMKQLGFPRSEWEDLLQNLAIEVLAFRFRPDRCNGASRTTVLCALINHRLVSMLRARSRYQRRLEQLDLREVYEEPTELRADVRAATADLNGRQLRVACGLSEGVSVCRIARDMGCPRGTVRRLVQQICRRFESIGLDGWVR